MGIFMQFDTCRMIAYFITVTSLQDRCSQQAKSFFTSILNQSSCLHHLPQQRDDVVTSTLRSAFKFPVPFVRTNKFQSLLCYGLRWYE